MSCTVITQGEITCTLGSVSQPTEVCDPPVASPPKSEGTITKSKKGASSQRNPRDGMLIIARTCTCKLQKMKVDFDSEDSESPLPKSRGAIVKSKKGTHSQRNLRSGTLITAHTVVT